MKNDKVISSTDEQRLKLKDALKTMQSNELIELREEIEKAITAEPTLPEESVPVEVVRVDESILSVKGAAETMVIEAYGKTFEFHVPAGAVKRYPFLDNELKHCTLVVDGKEMEASEVRGPSTSSEKASLSAQDDTLEAQIVL